MEVELRDAPCWHACCRRLSVMGPVGLGTTPPGWPSTSTTTTNLPTSTSGGVNLAHAALRAHERPPGDPLIPPTGAGGWRGVEDPNQWPGP